MKKLVWPFITISPRMFRVLRRAGIIVSLAAAAITILTHIVHWLR
ncbi:hypothetical protein ABAC460_02665 [Asticcacaulis sp. AC460]|nr:hypothetical protein [Asticcacaulis sp. AC460]ESQ92752.1 hypothetical protein ABAC460_02665 [Asticcacaulis sp. AC460]